MLDRRFQWVGIGVAYGGGQMWVAEVFMDGDGPPAAAGQPDRALDNAVRGPGMIGVQGWALDPNTIRADQGARLRRRSRRSRRSPANTIRADIGGAVPGLRQPARLLDERRGRTG